MGKETKHGNQNIKKEHEEIDKDDNKNKNNNDNHEKN